ncbi:MAG: SUMF1/EgtB/PvdO family nonheme iron enzyme, partial [Alistipes sp.]|nr:SUMF1/EgtB/PvdO family nonheme iron enzyme [Alistipes sp.]
GVNIDPIQTDMSNRPCARIKTRMNRMTKAEIADVEIKIIGGNAQVIRQMVADDGNGLIFEVTARNNLRFYFQHPEFGESNDVQLAVEGDKEYYLDAWLNQLYTIIVASNTVDADVYIDNTFKGRTDTNFVLTVKEVLPGEHTLRIEYGGQSQEQKINVNSNSSLYYKQNVNITAGAPQYVVFQIEPTNAVVVIDNKPYVANNGVVTALLPSGSHTYRISAAGFHDETDTITVSGEKIEKQVKLNPAFGWITLNDEAYNGAIVYIDNVYVATAPFSRKSVASGKHNIQIIKELYKTYNASIEVADSETLTLSPQLIPDYANIELSVEQSAEIWIDGKKVGVGNWSGKLQSGEHIAECRLDGHSNSTTTLQITADTPQNIKLDSPKPIYGSINITSTPAMADIYLDGKPIGRTPMLYNEAIIGRHMLRITKAGCADYTHDIVVEEGKTTTIDAMLSSGIGGTGRSFENHDNASVQNATSNANVEMIFVDGGSLTIDNQNSSKNITLPDYYIGKYEVTQAQWMAVMGTSIAEQCNKTPNSSLAGEGDTLPIYYITPEEAEEFCRRLSQQTGKKYRLPTEAEWEYAAYGGANSAKQTFSGGNKAIDVGWVKENSKGACHPVGSKQPNTLGIFDMTGNVAEWCIKGSNHRDSRILTTTDNISYTIRGGSWMEAAKSCKLGVPHNNNSNDRQAHIGFRVVMECWSPR